MKSVNLEGHGAAYIRVSTEVQDEQRQLDQINRWLARHGVSLPDDFYYTDRAKKRWDPENRPAFQRLLRDIKHGRVNWFVVDAQDRCEAEDKHAFIAFLHELRKSKARLYDVDDREITSDDIASVITTVVNSEQSSKELQDKADRVIKGKARLAELGWWQGGFIPFGLDVVCFDGESHELWRVQMRGRDKRLKVLTNGASVPYNGRGNFPATELGQHIELRPTTDLKQIKVVKDIYQWFDTEAATLNAIARRLRVSNYKPYYAERWEHYHARDILENPAYIGLPAWGKSTQGRFAEWRGGIRVVKGAKIFRRHAKEDWVFPKQRVFDPIVPETTWKRVQQKLTRARKHRAPRSADLWLSGLLVCAGCGKAMRGAKRKRVNVATFEYFCSSYAHGVENCTCQRNGVPQTVIENYISEFLADGGGKLAQLLPANRGNTWDNEEQVDQFAQSLMRALAAQVAMVAEVNGLTIAEAWGHPAGQKPDTEAKYRQLHDAKVPQVRAQLDELESEHSRLTAAWADLPTPMTKEKAARKLQDIETKIRELKTQLLNAADKMQEALHVCVDLYRDWEDARNAIETDSSARRRTEAIGRVIKEIRLTFRPTGKKYPTSELVTVEMVPNIECPDGASS